MTQEKYADKIAKLLRKAESTKFPEEAESLVAKAQELMIEYAIDEEMLARARGSSHVKENIIEERVEFHSTYSRAQYQIGKAIALANDTKVLITRGKDLMRTTMYVIGFESDVSRVIMLNSSLQIQSMGALTHWYNGQYVEHLSQRERFKMRRTFLFGFAQGLDRQLRDARARGLRTAEVKHGSDSVALVVRDKKSQVQAWLDGVYGEDGLRTSRGPSYNSGGAEAREAGYESGKKADTGKPSVKVGGHGRLREGSR